MSLRLSLARLLHGFRRKPINDVSAVPPPNQSCTFTCPHCSSLFELTGDNAYTASRPASRFGVRWSSVAINEETKIFGLCPACSQAVEVTIKKNGTATITARD